MKKELLGLQKIRIPFGVELLGCILQTLNREVDSWTECALLHLLFGQVLFDEHGSLVLLQFSQGISLRHALLSSRVDASQLPLVLGISLILKAVPSVLVHFESVWLGGRLDAVLVLLIHHFIVEVSVHLLIFRLEGLH